LRNPLLWSMALGVAWWSAGWQMLRPLDETLRLLGLAASPAALFTLGAILARAQRKGGSRQASNEHTAHTEQAGHASHSGPGRADRVAEGAVLPVLVGAKLLLHPLLVLAAGELVLALGWPLSGFGLNTLIMAAALPSASNVSMLAEREGADTTRVARLIMWTTGLSWLTLAAWAAWRGAALPAPG